jgi:hypothetical protein
MEIQMTDLNIHAPSHIAGFLPSHSEMASIRSALATVDLEPVPSDVRLWGDPEYEINTLDSQRANSKPASLTAVNDHLIVVADDLSKEDVEMITATVLFAQHVIQGYCTQVLKWDAQKVADPDTRNSKAFYDAVTTAISLYLPFVVISGNFSTQYHDKKTSGHIDIAQIVTDILKVVAAPGTAAMLAAGAAALASGDTGTGVDSVGTLFWNSKSHSNAKSQFTTTSAVKNVNYAVDYAYLLLYESMTQESWRSLFVEYQSEEFTFSAASLQIRVAQASWLATDPNTGKTVRQMVLDRLGNLFTSQIDGAPFA